MAFDEVQFPLRVGYGSAGGPVFSTEVVTIAGGYERRNQNWSQARRRYDAATGVRSTAEAAVLLAFFQARAGRARGFRLCDWLDYTSAADGISSPTATDQTLGEGDGTTLAFPLIKNYGSGGTSYARSIAKPVEGTVLIAVNGEALTSGWSCEATTGVVTFAAAPVSGAVLTAGFEFDVPVRFEDDRISIVGYDNNVERASIPLIEVRPT
jgi:uncharacterized protein (TIGR02217 family)